MIVVFEKGQNLEYTATKDFALNFEDRNIKSVKIKAGETVFFDGDTAGYKNQTLGRCPSLRSAINTMGWLVLVDKKAKKSQKPIEDEKISSPTITRSGNTGDYDGFRGGNFDSYAMRNSDGVHVASFKPPQIIREENLIVKSTDFVIKQANTPKASNLDVSGDQIEVRSGFTVNSSTSVNKEAKRIMPIEQRDEMGSENTSSIQGIKPLVIKGKKKSSFLVNEQTPFTINEDMTNEELSSFKVVQSDESQDARVVSKFNKSAVVVEDPDGITMRKKSHTVEGITITTSTQAEKDISLAVKVSSGSDHVASAQDEGVVVGKIPTPKDVEANSAAKAAERAASRKASAKETQTMMESQKAPKPVAVKTEGTNYLSMLPADWAKFHWTKKEVFIRNLSDKDFIKFIQTVEISKALQNACTTRLAELA